MVSAEVLKSRLKLLDNYLSDLNSTLSISESQYVAEIKEQRFVERTLQLAMEACIDIANHIISYEGYKEPDDAKSGFYILANENIISGDLANSLAKMVQFRNLLVHDYARVDPKIVLEIAKTKLTDLRVFAKAVADRFL